MPTSASSPPRVQFIRPESMARRVAHRRAFLLNEPTDVLGTFMREQDRCQLELFGRGVHRELCPSHWASHWWTSR